MRELIRLQGIARSSGIPYLLARELNLGNATRLHSIRCYSKMRPSTSSGLSDHQLAELNRSLNDPIGRELLRKFILNPTNETSSVKTSPFVDRGVPQKSAKIDRLKENLHVHPGDMLPLTKPLDVLETPFEFYSKNNSDASYIASPRLSVTKLLTKAWCELQTFYNIYSGSPRIIPTRRMQQGTSYHLKLELATHTVKDISLVTELVEELVSLDELLKSDPLVVGGQNEALMASEWTEHIIERLFVLATRSQARELNVYSFVDLQTSQFIHDQKDLSNGKGVLVSGIIDYVLMLQQDTDQFASFFEEIQHLLETAHPKKNGEYIVDFSDFIKEFKSITANYSEENTSRLRIADVKTRSLNVIPLQESVIQGAKIQGMYYKKFFDLMCQDKDICYQILLRYAAVKNVDVDKPIGLKYVLLLLMKHRGLLEQDFVLLCRGKAIGFENFDIRRTESTEGYMLSRLFLENNLKRTRDFLQSEGIQEDQKAELSDILLHDWLREEWKKPVTLRYLAARIAELYSIFEPFTSDKVAVEYHHNITEQVIGTKEYRYKEEELQESMEHAAKFWNGDIEPIPTADLSRCKYCDYQAWCEIPNQKRKKGAVSVGQTLVDFVNEKW